MNSFRHLCSALILLFLLAACRSAAPQTIQIDVDHSADLQPGEAVILRAVVPQGLEGEVQYSWSATRGELTRSDSPAVEFIAPMEPGRLMINLQVRVGDKNYTSEQEFNVLTQQDSVAQTSAEATDTPVPVEDMPPNDTPTLAVTLTSLPTETETATPTATENPYLIDNMENPQVWGVYQDELGSTLNLRGVAGETGDALELDFNLKRDGYVGIYRSILDLRNASGIRFRYQGSGTPSSLEVKLVTVDGAIFGRIFARGTASSQWGTLAIPIENFICWPDTGCEEGEMIDPAKVQNLDFAVSNKGDEIPGTGTLILDEVELIP